MLQPRGGGKVTWRVGSLGDAQRVERAVDMENPSRRQRREVAPEDSPASSVSDKEIVLWFAYLLRVMEHPAESARPVHSRERAGQEMRGLMPTCRRRLEKVLWPGVSSVLRATEGGIKFGKTRTRTHWRRRPHIVINLPRFQRVLSQGQPEFVSKEVWRRYHR